MSRGSAERPSSRRLTVAIGMAIVVAGLVGPFCTAAIADDTGIAGFFSRQFGIDLAPAPQPRYDDGMPDDRPLIVRPRHHKSASRKPEAIAVGPIGPVSIYDDKTLRPGDAVMTAKGLRVFIGNRSLPHTDADFTSLADVDGLTPQVVKALTAIDKAPRG